MSKRLFWIAGIAGAAMACSAFGQMSVHNQGGRKINSDTGRVVKARMLGLDRTIHAQRAARAERVNGQIVLTSDWINLAGDFEGRGPCSSGTSLHDNCLTDPVTGNPIGAVEVCALPDPTTRYWFGAAANNPHFANDMIVGTGAEGVAATRLTYFMNWGPAVAEGLVIAVGMVPEFSLDCTVSPLADEFIVLDYGVQAAGNGYYHLEGELCGTDLSWMMPADGTGGYEVLHLTPDPADPAALIGATGPSQPMLWGHFMLDGTEIADMEGDQLGIQYDDDNPLDGEFMVNNADPMLNECYDYTYALCPTPLGSTLKFWGAGGGPTCPPDFDGDGFLTGLDFDAFVIAFEAGEASADYDGDGFISGLDFDAYVLDFEAGC